MDFIDSDRNVNVSESGVEMKVLDDNQNGTMVGLD